ncbi:uncharacterized protein PHALS_14428 [Plasmopara halstedii]|uniref:Uncharacterized protein n=1 Tax=Plasmopara halstedii TaxID=4781 RepID=A0A0P1AU40_PLAHL|nr:uncharacterized protein PHALS_14428 [Plasmopara halstedii]CEG44170.1 hypothetical protein PHALS_14428 [Plasmopara halstedii]|eukprot:XP_024580539.1 hypothetical protein PHALS_14428 [Plasmopara halstedii]
MTSPRAIQQIPHRSIFFRFILFVHSFGVPRSGGNSYPTFMRRVHVYALEYRHSNTDQCAYGADYIVAASFCILKHRMRESNP